MSRGINNLKSRLNYYGATPQDRIVNDKLRSLKKALPYSYQSAIISLKDKEHPEKGFCRQFYSLINSDKTKESYDNKILSIPYEDIQLNAEKKEKTHLGQVSTDIAPGDVFFWEETQTYWIVYLQYKNERAYFRAEIRQCEKMLDINGNKYWIYFKPPVETTIPWNQKKGVIWNTPNYSATVYITKNEETLDYFSRFKIIKIDNRNWEVQVVSRDVADGIIELQLKEYFSNSIEEDRKEELQQKQGKEEKIDKTLPYIEGLDEVAPFDKVKYTIKNIDGGIWVLNTQKAEIAFKSDNQIVLNIITGRSGQFDLIYRKNEEDFIKTVTIRSL